MRRFDDKVVLVAGATAGMGRNAAIAFAAAGANVVISGRRTDLGEATVEHIEANGGTALFVPTDVANAQDVERLVGATVDRFGGLDLAYNVAGISGADWTKPFTDYSEASFDELMAINVKGMFLCMKYEIQAMLMRGGGAIVNMSSIAGVGGTPGGGIYVASKHAVTGMTKATALEYANQDIRINAVAPGVIYTEMLVEGIKLAPDLESEMTEKHPIGRLGQMEEVTDAVMWLCSPEASFVTGQTIVIDGGYTLK